MPGRRARGGGRHVGPYGGRCRQQAGRLFGGGQTHARADQGLGAGRQKSSATKTPPSALHGGVCGVRGGHLGDLWTALPRAETQARGPPSAAATALASRVGLWPGAKGVYREEG